MAHNRYQLASIDEHYVREPEFTKWWAWFRVQHQLDTVPYHLELAARIASLEAWIAAKRRKKAAIKQGSTDTCSVNWLIGVEVVVRVENTDDERE